LVIDGKSLITAWAAKVRSASSGVLVDESEFDNQHFVIATSQLSLAERGGEERATPVLTLLVENPSYSARSAMQAKFSGPVWLHDLTNELLKARRFDSGPSVPVPAGFQLVQHSSAMPAVVRESQMPY